LILGGLFGFGDRVEQDLLTERLLARNHDLGAVLVVVETTLALEVLTSIRRAGADIILTYHAKDMAKILGKG